MRVLIAVCALIGALVTSSAQADVLSGLQQGEPLKIGFREHAAPFSYRDQSGDPVGYTIELCRVVARDLQKELNLPELAIEFVPVSAENRFAALQDGTIDLLCGSTTATLSRREIVDFSIPTFIDGASVLYHRDGPSNFAGLAGKKVGVVHGATTETALRATLNEFGIEAEVVSVGDHQAGLEMLEQGGVSAYFADRGILLFLLKNSEAQDRLKLSEQFFTREPYALALPHGDDTFRLAVDRSLSRLYRSKEIAEVFARSFGGGKPTDLVMTLYVTSALPE